MSRCLYVVTVEVSPAAEKAWDAWHTEEHIPEVLREPGFVTARKYKDTNFAMGRWSRYVINYELESVSAFERYQSSEAAPRLRQLHIEKFGLETRVTRQVLVETSPTFLAAGRRSEPAKPPKPRKPKAPSKSKRRA
jgi:hypothetical protein